MPRPVAVVTGASSGIGAATVECLAGRGYEVVAAARRQDRLAALADRTGAVPQPLDVTDPASVRRLAEAVPRCDLLVGAAGGALGQAAVADEPPETWERLLDVNTVGTLRVVQALLPRLTASGAGTLVLVTSMSGHTSFPGGGAYSASKHAQRVMVETLRMELRGRPVRVVEVAPGMVRTEFLRHRFGGDAEREAATYARVPEPLTAHDVAECVVWAAALPPRVNVELIQVNPWH